MLDPDPSWPLFPTRIQDGRLMHMTPSGLGHIFTRLGRRAGLKVSPPMTRHGFGKRAALVLPLESVRMLLGHSRKSLDQTLRYTSFQDAEVEHPFAAAFGKPSRGASGRGNGNGRKAE